MNTFASLIKENWYRYFKFLFGGGLSLILNLAVTYLLTEFFQLWHMLSFALALCLEILFLFGYHSMITFRKKGHFLKFVIVILFISALNWVGVYLLSVILRVYYLLSIILVALIISILNYFLNKRLVFNRVENQNLY